MHLDRSHVTQVASDFPNKLPPRESRVPETFIDTLLCTRTHTGDNGPTWSFNPFSASLLAGCTSGPHFMLVMPLFPESVYYHRPVSSFMQNNLISRASKSRYNAAPLLLSLSLAFLSCRRSMSFLFLPFRNRAREEITVIRGSVGVHRGIITVPLNCYRLL